MKKRTSLVVALLLLVAAIAIIITGRSNNRSQALTAPITPPPGPLTLSVVPAIPRSLDKVRINILDTTSPQPSAPAKVTVSLSMPSMTMPDNEVTATPDGNGRYHATVQFTMPGQWLVTATVQQPNSVYDYSSSVTVQ